MARRFLIGCALLFMALFLALPLLTVFTQALAKGVAAYLTAISEPTALSAIKLTLMVAAISVPLNLVFGVAAAWALAKFSFRGKSTLITLIDLPVAISRFPAGASYPGDLRGSGHSARDHFRNLSFHRPRAHSRDAVPGQQ
jgi:sulfate transport system permease protein